MSEPIKIGASCWNYGDFTTAGVELSRRANGINNTIYAGVGMNSDSNSPQFGGVFDYRANKPVYNGENVNISTGVRIRTKVFDGSCKTENRAQVNFGGNVAGNLNWYGTAYGRSTIDWQNGNTNDTFGVFGGLTYKLPNCSMSVEPQLDNKNGLSLNLGASVNLGSTDAKNSKPYNDNAPILMRYDG